MISDQATDACDKLATVRRAIRSGNGTRPEWLAASWASISPVTCGDIDVDRLLAALDRQLTSVMTMTRPHYADLAGVVSRVI